VAAGQAAAAAADVTDDEEDQWGYAHALGAVLAGCAGLQSLSIHDAAGADGALLLRALPGASQWFTNLGWVGCFRDLAGLVGSACCGMHVLLRVTAAGCWS
jgi:hypothetical protein